MLENRKIAECQRRNEKNMLQVPWAGQPIPLQFVAWAGQHILKNHIPAEFWLQVGRISRTPFHQRYGCS
jgi:hypothetical protein